MVLERFQNWAALIMVVGFHLTGCTFHQQVPPARDPSVLFITLDTTRADHLGCYATGKSSGAKTPRLDALAAAGLRFAHATAQVPLTLPSHACIFTGTYPEVHQLRDMVGFVLDPKHLTLARMAQKAGFLTAAFVGSKAVDHKFGLQQGFDTYDDEMPLRTHEGEMLFPERRAIVTTDRALLWLEQHAGQKFFLWVHYYDPHDPYDPPEPYKSDYASDPYSGEIAYTDEQLGRLLDFLDQAKIRERTLVIAMGDHGEGLNDHGESTHGIFLYEETMRIPFILAGPRVPSGQVIQTQVRSIDLLPTVAEFLDLLPNPAAQGVSLWPLIEQGKLFTGKGSDYAYVETLYPKTYMNWSELRGMRTDRWKFVLAPRSELYDLEKDPGEKENVIKRYPAEADHLQQKIWEVIGPPQNDLKLDYMPVDVQTRQELASLGYVGGGSGRQLKLNGAGPDPKDRLGVLRELENYNRLIKLKSIEEAAQVLRRALAMDPANPMVRLTLGMTLEKLKNWRQAAEVYQGAVERDTATSEIFSRLGKVCLRLRDLDSAIAAMEKASSLNPTDLDNLNNLGTAYLLLKQADRAEKAFKAVLVQDDINAAAYNGLGLVAVQRGNTDEARSNFEKALELNPELVEPLLHLGLLYQGLGNKDEALRYFSLFLEKAPPQEFGHLLPQVRQAIQDLNRSN